MSAISHTSDHDTYFSPMRTQLHHLSQLLDNVGNQRKVELDPELRDGQLEQISNELELNKEEMRRKYEEVTLAFSLHFRLVARLNSRRRQLEAGRERALSAPIRALPYELFSEIFIWAHEDDVERSTLGTVCRSWRQIASRTPQLWTVINLTSFEHDKLRLTERRLQLAGNALLDIRLQSPMPNLGLDAEIKLHKAITDYGLHRWGSLIIGGNHTLFQWQDHRQSFDIERFYKGELTSLHSFRITEQPSSTLRPLITLARHAPALKYLEADNSIAAFPFFERVEGLKFTSLTSIKGSWSFLKSINFHTSLSSIHICDAHLEGSNEYTVERFDRILTAVILHCRLSFLQLFPNLTKLRVHFRGLSFYNPITLPHLQWLQITSSYIECLEKIIALKVETLDLWDASQVGTPALSNSYILSVFELDIPIRPKSLTFQHKVSSNVIQKILSTWPQLEDVEFFLKPDFKWTSKKFMTVLTQSRGGVPKICPNLTSMHFTYHGCRYGEETWRNIVQATFAARPKLNFMGSQWDDRPVYYARGEHSFSWKPMIDI